MKYLTITLISFLICLGCEPYPLEMRAPLQYEASMKFDRETIQFRGSFLNEETIAVEPMICEMDFQEYSMSNCLPRVDLRNTITAVGYMITVPKLPPRPPKGCFVMKGCNPKILFSDFVINIPAIHPEMVNAVITNEDDDAFAEVEAVEFDEEKGMTYLKFREVNPELRDGFLKLDLTTVVEYRGDELKVSIEAPLEEGFFVF